MINQQSIIAKSNVVFDWDDLSEKAADAYRLDDNDRQALKNSNAAKLVAHTPYLVEIGSSIELKRKSLAKLAIFIMAWKVKDLANHQKGETLSARVSYFEPDVCLYPEMAEGIDLILQLYSLGDHVKDQAQDAIEGKYNPVASGDIDPEKMEEHLMMRFENLPARVKSELDPYMEDAVVMGGWIG